MSTKSNDNASELSVVTHTRIRSLLSWRRILADAGQELAYFSGAARISERYNSGSGVILKFEHVRSPRAERFQPLRSREISPEFVDRAITALKRWKFDFVSIDQVGERVQQAAPARRFVCLSFDGGSRDFMTFAYPVLSRHRVPFTLYVPTGFIDGIASAWWLALEQVVARNARIALVMDRLERRFNVSRLSEKYELYEILHDWMLTLSPDELAVAINDLCGRYGVDLKSVSRDIAMTWQDLAILSRDPHATVGPNVPNSPNG
jgi:peptidoglycan/xylan/chitin deacetylase (PgdA/CDA1 family)